MHEIEHTDTVISTKKEWHDLQVIKPELSKEIIDSDHRNVYFNIEEGTAYADVNPELRDELLDISSRQDGLPHASIVELINTWSECPENKILTRQFEGIRYGLGVPSARYKSIPNQKLVQAVCNSLDDEGIDYSIETLGTLKNGKLFFSSLEIADDAERLINGDNFLFYLNLLQSHDGSYAMTMFDSNTRVVCANTFKYALGDQGDLAIKIKKTSNADLRLDEAGRTIANIYKGRDQFVYMMQKFAEVECDTQKAEALISAYKGIKVDPNTIMSTRAFNQIVDVTYLHKHGIGNKGETLYDLFNAVTEYYTSGDGSGHDNGTADKSWKKYTSSEFGSGADTKAGFASWLSKVVDDNTLHAEAERGKQLLTTKTDVLPATYSNPKQLINTINGLG
jgi:phage/plasmid-like protein (TIGR03299 family)